MATDKQVGFALSLLAKNGYRTDYMDRTFSRLGASMRQRSGTVSDWLRGMQKHQISALIDDLKGQLQ